ncbi:lipoyl synthase [Bathymodiolus japonicus methanotrophic gill symbiont]|uniref:lipoyl synthase n=1 Tax=Bathymodiolus japonicus methanotrophic gill symbiont TaxID=113269 RepID=UPI001B7CB254|nr:lipoyl synthase [Bathymodiolus japonicus methanotrophic gill symbiont]GFO72255.1 lipoyl synthase [Bathymodiolus japonicus methanotrophic gill symbiont]
MSSIQAPSRTTPETHQRNAEKLSRIPVKVVPGKSVLRKPDWIRIKLAGNEDVVRIKKTLRENKLHSVCEEAACPNLNECFSLGTATFMIMGDLCTRRCPFCDVAHGRPEPLDSSEPINLAKTIKQLALRYVVITSVDRDDLRDSGAGHFSACVDAIREKSPDTKIEVLVPDFRGRVTVALDILQSSPVDVFNHNLETVPRLYKQARPGAHYQQSLDLLRAHHERLPQIPTKSGLMLGIGETREEVLEVMRDLREHHCSILTLGQYLQPSTDHLAVQRYITPEEFDEYAVLAKQVGFKQVASGPMVRSSYHADEQARELLV